jgi:hypothetical protein
VDPENYGTNILLIDGAAFIKAEGSIRLAVGLGFPWSLAGMLRERFGPLAFDLALVVEGAKRCLVVRRWLLWGLPLPAPGARRRLV